MKVKNLALTISLIGFAIGFSDFRENVFFWMGRPVGAIAFVLFIIFALLDKETALLDEQESAKPFEFKRRQPLPNIHTRDSKMETCAPAPTTAIAT